MPVDIGVLTKLDKAELGPLTVKSTGNTTYTWQAYTGDIQFDLLKQLINYDGTTKLAQSIFKIVLTPLGSNIDDPDYGTDLPSGIGQKLDSSRFSDIQTSVVNALTHLNLINQDNPNSDEVIETVDTVNVVASLNDPRQINVQIGVTTESGKSFVVQVPQVM